MSVVRRMFRQQSARVASSSTSNSLGHQSTASEMDADEDDEKFVISAADDTALFLPRRQRPSRRAPVHSNSFVCLFSGDRTRPHVARGLSNHHLQKQAEPLEAGNIKRQGLIFRSASPSSSRLRCVTTTPVGQLTTVVVAKPPRPYSRTATFDNLAQFGRSVDAGFRLTAQQRSLIQQCWHAASRKSKSAPESAGSFVFRWLFKKEPRLKRIFGLASVTDDQLPIDQLFRKHAQTFSDVLEMVVDSVCAEQDSACLLDDTMGPFLCSYGAEHAVMEKKGSCEFVPTDWELFAAAVREFAVDSWRSNGSWPPLGHFQKRNEALHAWHVLVHFIVAKVKRGYELEKEKLDSSSKRPPASARSALLEKK